MKERQRRVAWWRKHIGNARDHKGVFMLLAALWVIAVAAGSSVDPRNMHTLLALVIVFWGVPLLFLVYGTSFLIFFRRDLFSGFRFRQARAALAYASNNAVLILFALLVIGGTVWSITNPIERRGAMGCTSAFSGYAKDIDCK